MYHDPSSTYMTVMHNPLPSPEYTGDSDSETEIILELEQKRRQLDEEVARFRALKDKEFRDFENELKAKRRQIRAQRQHERNNGNNYYQFTKNSPSATPPAKSMLDAFEKKAWSPNRHAGLRQSEPIRLMKTNSGSKVTPPTICLDKMNIEGEKVLQSHTSLMHTPPTQMTITSRTANQFSKATFQDSASTASALSEPPQDNPPFTPKDDTSNTTFVGLFVPNYLPLLDTRPDSPGTIEGTRTEPASPAEPRMLVDSVPIQFSSLPTDSSIAESFHVPATKRAYTSPYSITRKTPAPIIRNVNGRKRTGEKRKHVTFQLADHAIVEPSSSYEEGPSPDINDESDRRDSGGSVTSTSSKEADSTSRPAIQRRSTPTDPFGRRKRVPAPVETPEAEVGMSMGDLLFGSDREVQPTKDAASEQEFSQDQVGYFSPRHSISSPTSPSPEKSASFGSVDDNAYMNKQKTKIDHQRLERKNSKSPNTSPTVSRQSSFDQSHTRNYSSIDDKTPQSISVKPYQSPKFPPSHPPALRAHHRNISYPGTLEDNLLTGNANVGFFELDEELSSPTAGVPRPELLDDKDDDLGMKSSRRHGREPHASSSTTQTGSSVPINITKIGSWGVSNSWIGTFGH